jgi:hypothetical protein
MRVRTAWASGKGLWRGARRPAARRPAALGLEVLPGWGLDVLPGRGLEVLPGLGPAAGRSASGLGFFDESGMAEFYRPPVTLSPYDWSVGGGAAVPAASAAATREQECRASRCRSHWMAKKPVLTGDHP